MIWRDNQFAVWLPEHEELLRKLWPSPDLTVEQIAERVGYSAKATAGKAYRLLLPHRPLYRASQSRANKRWSEERDETLRSMWGKVFCRDIAKKLELTRSAVIGRAHRLGLVGLRKRAPNGAGRPRGKRDSQPRQPKPTRPYNFGNGTWRSSRSMPKEVIEETQFRCDFAGLNRNTCRFPIGTPGEESFCFCGAPPVTGKPYCGQHCARAYDNPWNRRPVNVFRLKALA